MTDSKRIRVRDEFVEVLLGRADEVSFCPAVIVGAFWVNLA